MNIAKQTRPVSGTVSRKSGGMRIALLASTILAFGPMPVAFAQSAPAAQAARQSISVPSGPLTPALNSLAAQTGLQILFDAELARGKTTAGASGALTPAQALDAVLAGTGIGSRFAGSNQVVLTVNTASTANGVAAEDGSTVLSPIVIYGARDATTLNATTSSVGIVSAKDIANSQIRTFRESFRRLGNVMDSAYVSSGFVIRGMSSEGFVPGGTPVGSLYIDGVLQTRVNARRATRSVWDMEQIEVYRGPQSTLSGRAAMTGAIYLKSKDPTFNKEAEVSATVGTDHLRGTAFMVNTPVIEDELAIRMSGSFERSTSPVSFPTYEQYSRYGDYVRDLSYNIRGKILWTPAELPDTRALLSYAFGKENPVDRFIGVGTGFGFNDNRGDFYQYPTWAEYRPIKTHNVGLEITHDFSNQLRFTSLSGLNYGASKRLSVDLDTPGVVNGINGTIDDSLFSQELRLNYEGDRLKWVGGVYGSYQDTDTNLDIALSPLYRQKQITGGKTTNLAVFGEATYEFVPTWNVTVGGRLDYLRNKEYQFASQYRWIGGAGAFRENSADLHEVNFVPKIGLSKEFGDYHTVGLTYSQGFRTGGYYINQRTLVPHYYDPEKAHSYELSYKGRFLDEQLTLNANLFYTKYKNQQIEIRPDPTDGFYRETQNAASSQAWGFEFEPSWQVNDNFSAFASVGFLKAKFLEFNHASYGNLAGQPLPEAPEWTVGFGGRYEFDNGFYLGADAKYTSGYEAVFGVAPQDKIESRVIVNAQAGFKKDNWEVNAFAENLFDEIYYTGIDRDATPAYAQIGPRRSFGVNLKAKF